MIMEPPFPETGSAGDLESNLDGAKHDLIRVAEKRERLVSDGGDETELSESETFSQENDVQNHLVPVNQANVQKLSCLPEPDVSV